MTYLRCLWVVPIAVAALSASGAVASASASVQATCTIVSGRADSSCTPGVRNPDVTQSTIGSTICVSGWTATIRPPSSYTTALKNKQKIDYGEAAIPNSALEEDHLLPLELGGAPRDPGNLWPEPRTSAGTTPSGQAAEAKDKQENALKARICNGSLTLAQAQQQMLAGWTH
jgi:hypothetical protein